MSGTGQQAAEANGGGATTPTRESARPSARAAHGRPPVRVEFEQACAPRGVAGEPPPAQPTLHPCPICSAPVGRPCMNGDGWELGVVHEARTALGFVQRALPPDEVIAQADSVLILGVRCVREHCAPDSNRAQSFDDPRPRDENRVGLGVVEWREPHGGDARWQITLFYPRGGSAAFFGATLAEAHETARRAIAGVATWTAMIRDQEANRCALADLQDLVRGGES